MQILSHTSEHLTAEQANARFFPTAFVRTDVFVHTGTVIVNIEDILEAQTPDNFLYYLCPAIDKLVATHLNLPIIQFPNHDTSILYKDIFSTLNLPTPNDNYPLDEIISDNKQYKQFFLNNNIAKQYQDTHDIQLNRLDLLNYLLKLGKTTLNSNFLFFSNK